MSPTRNGWFDALAQDDETLARISANRRAPSLRGSPPAGKLDTPR
jgi:hypothetical protein